MVGFGKKLREAQIQEWKGYYINYKLMKRKVKRYIEQIEFGALNHHNVLRDFSMLLDNQMEKIVLFLLEQQGVLAHRLSDIGQEHHTLSQQPNSLNIPELQEAYRDVGRDLLRLLYFVEMNAIGLRKILKKFDKRLGYKFTDYYVKTRANHPYSQLRQVFRALGLLLESYLIVLQTFRIYNSVKEATFQYMTSLLMLIRILFLILSN